MENVSKQVSVELSRAYVVWLLRAWRTRLNHKCLDDCTVCPSDKMLAKLINVTSATFSRLSTGVVTCSLPVIGRIYYAIANTIGESSLLGLQHFAHDAAIKQVCEGLNPSDNGYA